MDNKVKSNNAFVKSEQAKLASKMGSKPKLPAEMQKFNAYMNNDGAAAEAACRRLVSGLEDAFPVK